MGHLNEQPPGSKRVIQCSKNGTCVASCISACNTGKSPLIFVKETPKSASDYYEDDLRDIFIQEHLQGKSEPWDGNGEFIDPRIQKIWKAWKNGFEYARDKL